MLIKVLASLYVYFYVCTQTKGATLHCWICSVEYATQWPDVLHIASWDNDQLGFSHVKDHSLQDAFNKFVSPENVLQFSEGEVVDKAHIDNPVFDYVPPDLVTLYISNMWVKFKLC